MDEPSSPEGNAITLRIKFKSASLDEFVSRYGADVSAGGIFIRTKQPLAVGALLRFDFTLADGTPLMAGLGTVVWIREPDASRAGSIPGMGLRFDQLTPEGTLVHKKILAVKENRADRPAPAAPGLAPAAPVVPVARIPVRPATPPPVTVKRPAPVPVAALPVPVVPAPVSAPPAVAKESGEFDEFGSAGKTEIADHPPGFYFDNLGRKADPAAPAAPLEDTRTDSQSVPLADPTWSGAIDLPDDSGAPVSSPFPLAVDTSAPELPRLPSLDTTASELSSTGGAGDRLTSETLDLPFDGGQSFSQTANQGQADAPVNPASEASWMDQAMDATTTPAPVDTAHERTEEIDAMPESIPDEAPTLGADEGERKAIRDSEIDQDFPDISDRKPTGQGRKLIVVGIVAAGLAFGGVYLLQTKPWQTQVAPVANSEPIPVEPVPTTPPVAPKAAEPSQPAAPSPAPKAAAPTEAMKPAAPPPKQDTAKPKPIEAQAASEPGKNTGSAGASRKPMGKSAPAAPPSAPVAALPPSSALASAAAGSVEPAEEVYLLKVKSSPAGARISINGEPMGTTPFQRRILEVTKPHVVAVTRPGYESYEHTVLPSDAWVKSGKTSVLTLSAKLTKVQAQPAAPSGAPAPAVPVPVAPAPAAPAPAEPAAAAEQPEKL